MATLVTFHAHPDDESIGVGGVMRKAADEGHRVVLVVATRGENGEVPDGFLTDGEQLWQRRVVETQAAADILGVQRVEFLGYTDSGMMGTPTNDAPAHSGPRRSTRRRTSWPPSSARRTPTS
jgi:LmbE family N-acetylglucosaminyl deacetylase